MVQITHFRHSCVLLDTGSARLLIDPGAWSEGFESVTGLDAVLITHQHVDHLDGERLPALLRANPDSADRRFRQRHTAQRPRPRGRRARRDTGGGRGACRGTGGDHAVISPDVPMISNNAYLVDGTHLHPGDSFTPPPDQVEVLFVPTAAPWLKIAEAIDYLHAVAPGTAVPIHQAVLSAPGQQVYYQLLDT